MCRLCSACPIIRHSEGGEGDEHGAPRPADRCPLAILPVSMGAAGDGSGRSRDRDNEAGRPGTLLPVDDPTPQAGVLVVGTRRKRLPSIALAHVPLSGIPPVADRLPTRKLLD